MTWTLAILGGLVVLLAVIVLYSLLRRGSTSVPPTQQATETVTPSPTILLPTWTPIQATETPTLAPTQVIPTPTFITGDPATALGRPGGIDTFDNANNWSLFDSDCFKSEITGGKYVMTTKSLQPGSCWELSWFLIQNAYLQTDVQMPDACQPDDRFGLFFRAPDNQQGYLYGITCDGRYSLNAWDGNRMAALVDLGSNPAIKTGAGQVNRIGVLADGSYLALYANGTQLTTLQDSAFTGVGRVGYFVRTGLVGYVVKFDNLSIWLLHSESVGSERGFLAGIIPTVAPTSPAFNPTLPAATQGYPTFVAPPSTPTSTPKVVSEIVGATWYLTHYTVSGGSETSIADPDLYWLRLNPDGSLDARGDCNTAYGNYSLKDAKLAIDLTGGSSETCNTGSFSVQYFNLLESASAFTLNGSRLMVNLSGGGSLRFSP